jgi:hypothetical protein
MGGVPDVRRHFQRDGLRVKGQSLAVVCGDDAVILWHEAHLQIHACD